MKWVATVKIKESYLLWEESYWEDKYGYCFVSKAYKVWISFCKKNKMYTTKIYESS